MKNKTSKTEEPNVDQTSSDYFILWKRINAQYPQFLLQVKDIAHIMPIHNPNVILFVIIIILIRLRMLLKKRFGKCN